MHLGVARRQPLSHDGVVERRAPVLEPPGRGLGDGGLDPVAAQALGHLEDGHRPFRGEGALGDGPAPVLVAEEVLDRHDHVVEEDLVEVGRPPRLADRSHVDARRRHVDDQAADALVLGGVGVGADEEHAPVRLLGPAGPHLLPVDHVAVAVAHGAGLEAGQVGAGVGLGEALAPHLAIPDPGEVPLALLGGGVVEQGRGDVEDGDVEEGVAGDVAPSQLLGDHDLLGDREAAAPLVRPVRGEQSRAPQLPPHQRRNVDQLGVVDTALIVPPALRHVGRAPVADTLPQTPRELPPGSSTAPRLVSANCHIARSRSSMSMKPEESSGEG